MDEWEITYFDEVGEKCVEVLLADSLVLACDKLCDHECVTKIIKAELRTHT